MFDLLGGKKDKIRYSKSYHAFDTIWSKAEAEDIYKLIFEKLLTTSSALALILDWDKLAVN